MTKEEIRTIFNGLEDTQKKEVEKTFQRKRNQLFEWNNAEREKICEKLKKEGRYRTGLDATNTQPEVRKLSEEYNRRFDALLEECVCEILEQSKLK